MQNSKILIVALIIFSVVGAASASGLAPWQKPATVQLGNQYPVEDHQYGLSAKQQPKPTGITTITTSCVWCEYGYHQRQVQTECGSTCGNWQTKSAPTQSTIPVRIAPENQQRNGIGADGIQLYYGAELVNTLFETAFTTVFGQVADDIPTAYGSQTVVFETPIVMQSIVGSVSTMDELRNRGIRATACANRNGQTFAVAVAGSGPTVIAENQLLDTQWVYIIDALGKKYNLLFTRKDAEFWLINPQ